LSPFRDLPSAQEVTGKRGGKAPRFIAADDQSAAIRFSVRFYRRRVDHQHEE
jgi:hypothetical protein